MEYIHIGWCFSCSPTIWQTIHFRRWTISHPLVYNMMMLMMQVVVVVVVVVVVKMMMMMMMMMMTLAAYFKRSRKWAFRYDEGAILRLTAVTHTPFPLFATITVIIRKLRYVATFINDQVLFKSFTRTSWYLLQAWGAKDITFVAFVAMFWVQWHASLAACAMPQRSHILRV